MSFRLKVILGVAAIEILLLSILVISGLNYIRSSNEDQLRSRAETTAELFATMTSDAVVATDLATLDILVGQAARNPGILYLRVLDHHGTILAKAGKTPTDDSAVRTHDVVTDLNENHQFDVTVPISVAGTEFGKIELGLDTRGILQTLRDASRWMLSVAALEISLVAFFGFILGGILTQQLDALQKGARRVAEGHFGHRIQVHGSDELADTARSFNRMSTALAEYATELEAARMQAEAGRDRAESVLQDAVESLNQGVLIVDTDGVQLKRNSAFDRLYPMALDELPGTPTIQEITSATAPFFSSIEENGHKKQADGSLDYLSGAERWTSRLKDGRSILHSRRQLATGGWVFIETDITAVMEAQERARVLERELMQSQKMEALGTLAGGIAHEINTPIQYIGDNLRFLEDAAGDLMKVVDTHRSLAEAAQKQDALADWVNACQAAYDECDVDFLREEALQAARQSIEGVRQVSNIVLAMKEFSHPASKEMGPVDLNRVLERSAVVCKSEWKHVAEIAFELDESLPEVVGLEGALNQVALNMIVNAAHAVADKGTGMGKITVRTKREDDKVRLEISDTGTGIPAHIRDRIFEPFFTTKDVGRGTGQGLALAHDIVVNKHHGQIRVKSTEGEGTTFIITLPIDAQDRKAA